MNAIRAFIAIRLPEEITLRLSQVMSDLQTKMPGGGPVRWSPADNIHLTLKFLGEVSSSSLEMLKKALASEASRHAPFDVSVGGLGAFPSMRRPNVVWVGVEAPSELGALQRGIESEMAHLGYPPEDRPFSPHLTLGRVGRNTCSFDQQQLGQALASCKVGFLGAARVQDVALYRSDLTPTGAVYTTLFVASLAAVQTR
jgi:2'-5' RNA ligase